MKYKIFFPNLDGLRFFSFLAVFLSHSFYMDIIYFKENAVYQFIKQGLFRKNVIFSLPVPIILERLVTSIVFSLVILEQNFSDRSLFKISNLKLITMLGKYTYGLYCFHTIGILIIFTLLGLLKLNTGSWQVVCGNMATSLIVTILMSLLSYKFFESPLLRLKNRFSYIVRE